MRLGFVAAAALALSACTTIAGPADHPEATPFAVSGDAMTRVDAALAAAGQADKRVLLVTGANWCHDSRALAGWLESDRFAPLLAENYEVVYVDIGMPQTDDGKNLDVPERFGHKQDGTPNLLVLAPDGTLVNGDTAASWRNSAARSGDAIYAELADLARRAPVLGVGQDIVGPVGDEVAE